MSAVKTLYVGRKVSRIYTNPRLAIFMHCASYVLFTTPLSQLVETICWRLFNLQIQLYTSVLFKLENRVFTGTNKKYSAKMCDRGRRRYSYSPGAVTPQPVKLPLRKVL